MGISLTSSVRGQPESVVIGLESLGSLSFCPTLLLPSQVIGRVPRLNLTRLILFHCFKPV